MRKIPDHAKKVFKGEIFDVYQWDQELFDGTHHTFEMLKRPDTNQIITVHEGKIVVTFESQPNKFNYYSFPGGRANENEDPLESAKRELIEETGFTSDDWDLYNTYEPFSKIDWKIHYFIARNCKKTQEPHLDPGEKIELKYLTFDDFMQLLHDGHYSGHDFVTEMMKVYYEPSLREAFKKRLGL